MSIQRVLATIIMLLTGTAASFAQISLPSADSIVVLRNGSILRGHVTPLGDLYLVTLGESDRVKIPAARVEMTCRNLDEAYRRKRDKVGEADVRGHLKLADWCLRHNLRAGAADQILAAAAWNPSHPSIRILNRQLLSSTEREQQSMNDAPQAATSQENQAAPIQLSARSVQQYTASVQPLLINRCATGACHGAASASHFRLLRPPVGHLITSRLTQRNLRAVLSFVNRNAPASSPLVVVPQRPHGGLSEPVITQSDAAQRATLLEWIGQLRNASPAKPSAGQTPEPEVLMQRLRSAVRPFDALNDLPVNDAIDRKVESGFVPRDAFDPDIFNRRSE